MEAQYAEHQEAIRKTVRDFCLKEVVPGAEERDRTGEFDYGLYRRLGELGLTGILSGNNLQCGRFRGCLSQDGNGTTEGEMG